jgi:acetyltransferase-like isoleucine patch superfamily enzyme
MQLGSHVFIGDRVVIYQGRDGGALQIGDDVHINQDCILETAQGGSISIGGGSRIQPRCQFSAYLGQIVIGRDVQIAPNCAFYPYDHEIEPNAPIKDQPLKSRGGIAIEDDVWLGHNVVVLDGVRIGAGAVIGAGSVVKSNVPSRAIAVGSPARVVKRRDSSGFGAHAAATPETKPNSEDRSMSGQ